MSKTIKDYIAKHPDKFESKISIENNWGEAGKHDYWVYCKAPWFSPDTDCQTIHEYNVKDTIAAMRGVTKGKFNGHSWEA